MPRRTSDTDFKIFVDPSCLSNPLDDDGLSGSTVPNEKGDTSLRTESGQVEQGEIAAEQNNHSNMETKEGPDQTAVALDSHVAAMLDDTNITEGYGSAEPASSTTLEIDDLAPHPDTEGSTDHPEALSTDAAEGTMAAEDDDMDNESTPRPTQIPDTEDELDNRPSSRLSSASTDRRASLRTEALIQAAARAVVARMEKQHSGRPSMEPEDDADISLVSSSSREPASSVDGTEHSYEERTIRSPRTSSHNVVGAMLSSDGEGGDSSSHHELDDDDVFSSHSPRSSLGSSGEEKHSQHGDSNQIKGTRSPRVSGISELAQYEKDEFIPTARGTPRMPFRTPSDVRAMQMSSPPPSVFSGASPRSNKRQTIVSSSGFPTVSRLGSPSASAQYSPKRRSTPPRFKSRKEAPLVLLHATLLPLRWAWGDVLDRLESTRDGDGPSFEPSEQFKTLRDAWRLLRDRIGDTVLERGILLPHPQNDYEVLEERLLEALELPLRRRARILECGHYLGPANEMMLSEEEDNDDDDGEADDRYILLPNNSRQAEKRHWCKTCQGEIKYDELGPGKVFRIKVYASNGLMKAGAWLACWKEMERVDVEVEPIVEPSVQSELERLASLQMEEEIRQERDRQEVEEQLQVGGSGTAAAAAAIYPSGSAMISSPPAPSVTHLHASPNMPLTSSPSRLHDAATPLDMLEDERRRRDQERLREIYGHTPPPHLDEARYHTGGATAPTSTTHIPQHPDSYIPPPSPPSPSQEAYERRELRRRSYQALSLPELLLEAVKVLLRDRKNVAIAVLSFLILALAVRTAPPNPHEPMSMSVPEAAPASSGGQQQQQKIGETWQPGVGADGIADGDAVISKHVSAPQSVVVEKPASASTGTRRGDSSAEDTVSANIPGVTDRRPSPDELEEDPPLHVYLPPTSDDSSPEVQEPEIVTERKVVRVFETVTETETVKVKTTVAASDAAEASSLSREEDAEVREQPVIID